MSDEMDVTICHNNELLVQLNNYNWHDCTATIISANFIQTLSILFTFYITVAFASHNKWFPVKKTWFEVLKERRNEYFE
jgi:ABC-type dipeptide/oligopeptide/nickel transport system permease component